MRLLWVLALAGAVVAALANAGWALVRVTNPKPGSTIDIDEPTKPDPRKPLPSAPSRALQDTIWIADWTFDSGGLCTSTGWIKYDNRILNVHNDADFWHVDNRFNGLDGLIVNRSAILAKHDLCWFRDGYGNDLDFSVILKAGPGATVAFDQVSDSEPGLDFVTVEADSLGLSESLANICADPSRTAAALRVVLAVASGPTSGSMGPLPMPAFGPGTHEFYIRFTSNGEGSDEDGGYPTTNQAGLIVDNVVVTGPIAYTENFEGALNANVTLIETANSTPFCAAPWARLFSHITDNDKCRENTTCAWLFTDPLRPAFFPSMAFGPGQAVIHNWLDDVIVSPWVSLASTPTATTSLLSFRVFPGNRFAQSKIIQSWRVRSKTRIDNTDTSAPGDSIDCVSPWSAIDGAFFKLESFTWQTQVVDLTFGYPPVARELQVSARVSDWQLLSGGGPPAPVNTGPGPYLDRVRIGRRVGTGPAVSIGLDARSQAQDAFPTVQNAILPGEHFSPDGSNRFGTCAFSAAADIGLTSANVVTGDSIWLPHVIDARGAGGVNTVRFYGAITSGPHSGKAPAPYTIGGNGFFEVSADSSRAASGIVIRDAWFIDLDDTYFRGGDVLKYFWAATDNAAGFTSEPLGLTALPASVTAAEAATHGLREVSYLPTIVWDPAYLAAIAADAHGDINPTPTQLANSTQKDCILYVNALIPDRRSTLRASFTYVLDQLGYSGYYDIYDVIASGNANNELASRANVGQASGYALVIQDAGTLRGTLPNGSSPIDAKVNQSQWYRDYLAQGLTGLAGTASIWLFGENVAEEYASSPLLSVDCGLASVTGDQGLAASPDVRGQTSFTFAIGSAQSFVGNNFALDGSCPDARNFDGFAAAGSAVVTHKYAVGATLGTGAIIMNKNSTLHWNTVFMGFPWSDIRDTSGSPGQAGKTLTSKVLSGVLPVFCQRSPMATGTPDPGVDGVPWVTALHACTPNPFNPTARLTFDLAHAGHVRLRVFDAAGRVVRTLVDAESAAGRRFATWNGLDSHGQHAASGIYFAHFEADGTTATQKLVLLR